MIFMDNYTQLRLLCGVFVNLVVYIKAKIIEWPRFNVPRAYDESGRIRTFG